MDVFYIAENFRVLANFILSVEIIRDLADKVLTVKNFRVLTEY
jgi:hypothetical protein